MTHAGLIRAVVPSFAVVAFLGLSVVDAHAGQEVLAEIFELPDGQTWPAVDDEPSEQFEIDVMALPILPRRYSDDGLIIDRQTPFVLRLSTVAELDEGDHDFLLRAMNRARLLIEGREVAATEFTIKFNDGHNRVPKLTRAIPDLRMLAPGHAEQIVSFHATDQPTHVVVEAIVGGKQKRPETGELCLCVRKIDGSDDRFLMLGGDQQAPQLPLTDAVWNRFVKSESIRTLEFNQRRRQKSNAHDEYWSWRHEQARKHVESLAPIDGTNSRDSTATIDGLVLTTLGESKQPQRIDDYGFLRRLALDTVGTIPTLDEIEVFLSEPPERRRAVAIDRYLSDDRWADHWVSYWQDVLAENPGILKPKLNNTGPFRWWVYESFLDNKPIDRFVTELIMMRGSVYAGGPAGFSMATQNDVPMAAKAHVLGQAFLGIQMKCARCHDAPQHELRQEQLFQLAAMLKRQPQKVPHSSSIPADEIDLSKLLVEVSLKPGSEVTPIWPFEEFTDIDTILPNGIVQNPADTRERLAAIVTSYRNQRFARVIVNRLWHRFMGAGIVDSVDDWEHATIHSPELLDYLARQLIGNRFDLKHVAKLILNSGTYQSEMRAEENVPLLPVRRRQSAEQLVDSLFTISNKPLKSEMLNLDVDGQRPVTSFLNLGTLTRAWEFTSLSNERDRPALAMPRAQSIVDVLTTFGWRDSRQDPITSRDTEPTVQQPGIVANGVVAQRTTCLSDDNRLTQLCLTENSVDRLTERLFLQILTRRPSAGELKAVSKLLQEGFESRVVGTKQQTQSATRHAVSWSNHLNEEATRLKLEEERLVRKGDPPTLNLTSDWRERCEDVVWALINSPEFVFVP